MRVGVGCRDVDGPSTGVLTDFVPTVVVVAEVVVVVVSTSSGDVTKSEIDRRFDKRVGWKAGCLKMLSRSTIGLLCGLLIVTDNHANSAVM